MKPIVNFLIKKEGSQARDILVLLVLFGALFFLFLGRFPLIDPDEGRYAEIPREMIELGDFITPHLNYVKYFEKPPLYYWLTASSFIVFGQNEFAARFPAAVCGLLGVLLTYFMGRKLFGRRDALLSALVLGSSVGYLAQGRIAIIDMTLTLCLTASLGFFLLASREGEKKKGLYYHLFYVFAALAVLAKGLIGIVLPGAVIFFYLLFSRRWMILREMRLPTGIPLFLLAAAPWFVLVSIKNPEFARFFFIHEHFERYLTKVHGRYEPPWFFIPVLIGVMFPWSFFFPAAARTLRRERKGGEGDTVLYLFLWATVIFAFFSLSDSKLIPYILPVLPAAALLLGNTFSRVFEGEAGGMRIELRVGGIFLFILGAGIILYPHVVGFPKIGIKEAGVVGGLIFCEGLLMMTLLQKSKIVSLFAALVLLSCLLGICAPLLIMEDVSEARSSKKLGLYVRERAGKEALVANYGAYQQGFSFYSRRRVVLVDNMGELKFGGLQGDNSAWFINSPRLVRLWQSSTPVYLVIHQRFLLIFRQVTRSPVIIVDKSGEMLLVSNR